jgi:hypothetical protein
MTRTHTSANLDTVVDLNMPADLTTDDQRRQWLRETGAALAHETGQPRGQTEHLENEDGETSWIMWWTDEEYVPRDRSPVATDDEGTAAPGAEPSD